MMEKSHSIILGVVALIVLVVVFFAILQVEPEEDSGEMEGDQESEGAGDGDQSEAADVGKDEGESTESEVTESGPIKIGFISPLTGDIASIGIGNRNAVELAVEEINNAGGINGREIKMIYEDGRCNGKDASNAANKLILVDEVKYIIGGLCSSETLAAAPVAEENEVVMISPASSSPDVTEAGEFIFRVYPSDSFQGVVAAEYAYYELEAKRVAVFSCLSDWCVGLKNVFSAQFEESGGEVTLTLEFAQGSTDLKTELTKIKEANVDLIYMPAYTESTINGIKQAAELGIEAQFFGGDVWGDQDIWAALPGISDGILYMQPDSPASAEFSAAFAAKFGEEEPVVLAAPQAYDALNLLVDAIEEVGDDSAAVRDYLYTIEDYSGASGSIGFDENGDLLLAKYMVMEVKDGAGVEKVEEESS